MKKIFYSLIILAGLTSFNTQAITYTIKELGTLGGSYSIGYGINSHGHVTGKSGTIDNENRAFLYDGTTMRDLGVPQGGSISAGYDINDSGQVVGRFIGLSQPSSLFFYDDNTMQAVVSTIGSFAAINNNGQLTATTRGLSDGSRNAFIYDSRTQQIQSLGTLGGITSTGYGINDLGHVVGTSRRNVKDVKSSGFIYDGTTMRGLGTLDTEPHDINNLGQVTGIYRSDIPIRHSADPSFTYSHAFLYNDTSNTIQDLGTLRSDGLGNSIGLGINSSGQVVGKAFGGGALGDAFLYKDNTMLNLCALVDCHSAGWLNLTRANDINDNGDIVGTGIFGGTEPERRAFLITASATNVPAPATLLLSITGLIGAIGVHRRRRYQ